VAAAVAARVAAVRGALHPDPSRALNQIATSPAASRLPAYQTAASRPSANSAKLAEWAYGATAGSFSSANAAGSSGLAAGAAANDGAAGAGARQTAAAKASAKNANAGDPGEFILPILGGSSRPPTLCVAGAAIATATPPRAFAAHALASVAIASS
jgi:hypothetical protein